MPNNKGTTSECSIKNKEGNLKSNCLNLKISSSSNWKNNLKYLGKRITYTKFRFEGFKALKKNGRVKKDFLNLSWKELKKWKINEIKFCKNIKRACLGTLREDLKIQSQKIRVKLMENSVRRLFSAQQWNLAFLPGQNHNNQLM